MVRQEEQTSRRKAYRQGSQASHLWTPPVSEHRKRGPLPGEGGGSRARVGSAQAPGGAHSRSRAAPRRTSRQTRDGTRAPGPPFFFSVTCPSSHLLFFFFLRQSTCRSSPALSPSPASPSHPPSPPPAPSAVPLGLGFPGILGSRAGGLHDIFSDRCQGLGAPLLLRGQPARCCLLVTGEGKGSRLDDVVPSMLPFRPCPDARPPPSPRPSSGFLLRREGCSPYLG